MFYFIYLYIFTHTGIKQISISDDVRDINGSTSWAGTRYPYRTTEFPIDLRRAHVSLVYNYFIWSMIKRGSDTSFTNLWSLLLYIQSLLHYIENAQEKKKNTILSYNIAENSKRIKRNEYVTLGFSVLDGPSYVFLSFFCYISGAHVTGCLCLTDHRMSFFHFSVILVEFMLLVVCVWRTIVCLSFIFLLY